MINLIRNEWRLLLFGFLMTFWSSPGQTYLISLFSGQIRGELALSDGDFAGIYSLATLLSAMVMIWSGALVDKIDLKKFSIALVLGLAAGCGFMSISTGVLSLLISMFLIRHLGQGLMCITSSTAVIRYLDQNKGKSSALAGMGYAVSEAVMPSIVVAMLLLIGWRISWQVIGVVVVLVMVPAIILLLRNHSRRHENYLETIATIESESNGENKSMDSRRQWTRAEVIRDKRFYLFAPGLMSQQLMFTGFIFHQVHLVESKNWSLTIWASLFALYAVVSVVTKLVTGVLVDRYGAIRMVPLVGLPMGIGLVILSSSTEIFWGGAFLVLTGVTVGYQSTVTAPFWSEMYGNKHLGSIKSLGASVMVFCTAVSPFIIGWFIDRGTSMDILAMASAIYMFVTSALAYYAYRLTVRS